MPAAPAAGASHVPAAASPHPDTPPPARGGGFQTRILPALGILLVTGGLALLAWFAYLWTHPGTAPYRYILTKEGNISEFSELGMEAWPDLTLAQYEIRTDAVPDPIAHATTARRDGQPPVLISWENRTSELLVSLDSKLEELTTLAVAIDKYAARDARILAWWDISRQLDLLSGRKTLFTHHLGEPLIAPTPWEQYHDAIRHQEAQFWGDPAPAEERRTFERFVDALLSEPAQGAALLRELADADQAPGAPAREAYVVIHVTDLYKLGLVRPDAFDITYKHFPMENNMHGMIGYIKNWSQDNNFITYTLQSLSESLVRGYFLRDESSTRTLLAQMLPFTRSTPLNLTALQLIYQQGGYWVYKIPAAGEALAASPRSHPRTTTGYIGEHAPAASGDAGPDSPPATP